MIKAAARLSAFAALRRTSRKKAEDPEGERDRRCTERRYADVSRSAPAARFKPVPDRLLRSRRKLNHEAHEVHEAFFPFFVFFVVALESRHLSFLIDSGGV